MSATLLYAEDFEAYTLGSHLTDNPPNFSVYQFYPEPGEKLTVETAPWGGRAAKITDTTNGWVAASYAGDTFGEAYYRVRAKSSVSVFNARLDLGIRGSGATGPAGCVNANGYIAVFFSDGPSSLYILVKCTGGGGSILAMVGVPSGIDLTDAELAVSAFGSTITMYYNGVPVLSAVDSAYSSGFIGFQSSGANCFIDDIKVYDAIPTAKAALLAARLQRR